MKKWFVFLLIAAMLLGLSLHATAEEKTMLKAIVINMGEDKTVTDALYDGFFAQGSALEGVRDILAAGKFRINGFAIPATAEAFNEECPEGWMLNQSPWLIRVDDGYKVDRTTYADYADAALAAATGFDAGLEVRLYDADGDGYTDEIDMDYVEAVIVSEIIENADGTYQVKRSPVDPAWVWDCDGRFYDGEHFTEDSGEIISAANFDPALQPGDVGLFWYGPDGWAIERAVEVKGILVDGQDHGFYQIGEAQYQDAMRFSRDNIIISNRCGELTNAHKYFGFNNNTEGLEVSLWFVPTTEEGVWAAPAGFTTAENAPVFLQKAIDHAKSRLNDVPVSAAGDGTDIAEGDWVTQQVHDQLAAAIERAEAVLASDAKSDVLDCQIYLLYFSLNGIGDDIGAMFGGFDYDGFENCLNGNVPEKHSMNFGFGG